MEGAQGQFAEKDNESNETFFELRNYDPLLGRFNNIDPYGQYFSPYLAMGNSHPNMIDPDGGYSASNPFLGTGGFGSGGASGLQILGSVSGVLSAAMMGNAFAFQNAVGELNFKPTTDNPYPQTLSYKVGTGKLKVTNLWTMLNRASNVGGDNLYGPYIQFDFSAGDDDEYAFVQTISTNMTNAQADNILNPNLEHVEFVDGSQVDGANGVQVFSGAPKFYINGSNPSGTGDISVWDQPGRKFSKRGDVYFNAETSLVKKVGGKYVAIKTVAWGYTLKKSGKVVNKKLKFIKASKFHKSTINGL